jgi:soluble lytic murein transglycosylase-like protein
MTLSHRPLTIRDYIELAGNTAPKWKRIDADRAPGGRGGFERLLNRSLAARDERPRGGLTAEDYFANPVRRPQAAKNPRGSESRLPDLTPAAEPPPAPQAAGTASGGRTDIPKPGNSRSANDAVGSLPGATSQRIEQSIGRASRKYGLPANLIRGVIRAESNFDVDAVSPAGAQGLMQLMPGTAGDLGVKNVFDIEENVDGGARYLKLMLQRFGGDVELALAAYNAGPGTVEKYDGQVPYSETRHYVQRVLRFAGLKA